MTIEETKKSLKCLEEQITKLMNDFEKNNEVNITIRYDYKYSSYHYNSLKQVTITAQL